MDTLEILKAARAKIARPENWGKGRRGEDRSMLSCCAAEAIEEVDIMPSIERRLAYRAVINAAGAEGLVSWNDAPERTHAEVLAAFNLAIATLRLR